MKGAGMYTLVFIELILGLLAYCLNGLVIYISIKKSPIQMLAYRQLIIYNCAVDLLYSTIMILTIEVVEIREGVLFYVSLSSLIPARLAAPIWVFAILLVITNIPIQFVSRYEIIKNGQQNRTKIVCLYLFLVTLMAIHCLAFPLSCSDPNEFYVNMLREISTFKDEAPSFYICNDFRDQQLHRLRIFIHGFYSMVIVTLCYAIAIWAFIKTYRFLADHRVHFSTATQRVQLQVVWVMIIQAACPLITHFIPFSLVVFFTLLKIQWRASFAGFMASMFVSFSPVLNALIVLLVVRHYRRFVFRARCTSTISQSSNFI